MRPYKVTYEFASKATGALLRGTRIVDSESEQEAAAQVLNALRGEVKYPRIVRSSEYQVDQLPLL